MAEALNLDYRRTATTGHSGYLKMVLEDPNNISDSTKKKLLNAIKNEQMEILNAGAIIDPDTACTNFLDIISEYQTGFNYLSSKVSNFKGKKTAFLIDSFGISLGTAKLMYEAGFDNMVFTRVPTQEAVLRRESKRLSYIWNLGFKKKLNIDLVNGHYGIPYSVKMLSWMSYDELDIFSTGLKIPEYCSEFVKVLLKTYKSSNQSKALYYYGDDCTMTIADEVYRGLDAMIAFIRSNDRHLFKNCTIEYSSIENYFKEVFFTKEIGKNEDEDYLPFVQEFDEPYSIPAAWTGFYTSRPFYKKFMADYSKVLRGMINLFIFNRKKLLKNIDKEKLERAILNAKWVVGIFAHHDAITGTALNWVMDDYMSYIEENIKNLSFGIFKRKIGYIKNWKTGYIDLRDMDSEILSGKRKMKILVFNPGERNGEFEIKFFVKKNEKIFLKEKKKRSKEL